MIDTEHHQEIEEDLTTALELSARILGFPKQFDKTFVSQRIGPIVAAVFAEIRFQRQVKVTDEILAGYNDKEGHTHE